MPHPDHNQHRAARAVARDVGRELAQGLGSVISHLLAAQRAFDVSGMTVRVLLHVDNATCLSSSGNICP